MQFILFIECNITKKNSTGRDSKGEGKGVIFQKANSLAYIICNFFQLGGGGICGYFVF